MTPTSSPNKPQALTLPLRLSLLLLVALARSCRPAASSSRFIQSASSHLDPSTGVQLKPFASVGPTLQVKPTEVINTTGQNSSSEQNQQNQYKLPSWFDYQLYKRFHGKSYKRRDEDELHRRIYLRTALKVFNQRALYRAQRTDSLSSLNELSDLTADELMTFRGRSKANLPKRGRWQQLNLAAEQPTSPEEGSPIDGEEQQPSCCSYDQVYTRIIGLLDNSTQKGDLVLSRAFVEELEQKPLVDSELIGSRPEVGADNSLERNQTEASSNRNASATYNSAGGDDDDARKHSRGTQTSQIVASAGNSGKGEQLNNSGFSGSPSLAANGNDYRTTLLRRKSNVIAPQLRPTIEPKQNVLRWVPSETLDRPASGRNKTNTNGANNMAADRTSAGGRPSGRGREESSSGDKRKLSKSLGQNKGDGDKDNESDNNEETRRRRLELEKAIRESVERQVSEQLSPGSPVGRQLRRQLSEFFGQPVELRATIGSI